MSSLAGEGYKRRFVITDESAVVITLYREQHVARYVSVQRTMYIHDQPQRELSIRKFVSLIYKQTGFKLLLH
jgi:hypothetical protein